MSDSFKKKVRNGQVKSPVQREFKLNNWQKAWDETVDLSDSCEQLFNAGKVFHSILDELRTALTKLYAKSPKVKNETLLMAYIAISNRDREILCKSNQARPVNGKNIFSRTISNNAVNNEITLQEVADGCVDGLQKAIFYCVNRIKKQESFSSPYGEIEIVDFITVEANISQIYNMCENYWQAILWGDYSFNITDEGNKLYNVQQLKTAFEISYEASQIRRSRLSAQSAMIASRKNISHFFDDDSYLCIKKSGRKKQLKKSSIKDADDMIRYFNSNFRTQELFLIDEFPEELLKAVKSGFCIKETLNIFRLLVLLSHTYSEKYPDNDGFQNINKLNEFCPKFKKTEFINGISSATGYSFKKTKQILEFLEFDGAVSRDLWCHPVISIDDKYAILTSSLVTPSIVRVVEHWLVELEIEMQDKGLQFEQTIIDEVNASVAQNQFVDDYNECASKRFKLKNGEEEIDLLLRIGNLIVLGEAKSIVTTDSPISQYRTVETLRKASDQAKRKSQFVLDNTEEIFERLGWEYTAQEEYKVTCCILNSSRIFAGLTIDDVPVCDKGILTRYFSDNLFPIISRFNDDNTGEIHLAWYELYSNSNELVQNFEKYLRSPPQIAEISDDFEYKSISIPCRDEDSYKLLYTRLVPKDTPIMERISKRSVFPIHTVDDIEKHIDEMDIFM